MSAGETRSRLRRINSLKRVRKLGSCPWLNSIQFIARVIPGKGLPVGFRGNFAHRVAFMRAKWFRSLLWFPFYPLDSIFIWKFVNTGSIIIQFAVIYQCSIGVHFSPGCFISNSSSWQMVSDNRKRIRSVI